MTDKFLNKEFNQKTEESITNILLPTAIPNDFGIRITTELNKKLWELLNSVDYLDRLCAIKALTQIIEIDKDDSLLSSTRYPRYLRLVLPGNDYLIMEYASKALGEKYVI